MTLPIPKQTKRRDLAMAAMFGDRPLGKYARDNVVFRLKDALLAGRGITARRLAAICAQAVMDNGQATWGSPKIKFKGFAKYFESKRLRMYRKARGRFKKTGLKTSG
jgi:hypothetical protein